MTDETIFNKARQISSTPERDIYLAEVCNGAEQRRRVDLLLAANDQTDSLLDEPIISEPTQAYATSIEQPGVAIDSYKLLQQIGEGGFGVVYLAEQQEPVNRRVALKVIKPGMDSRQVIARFEAERQALAMMDHPHIAKVLDAGMTEGGRPYFVMELVKGLPITQFCDEQRLTPRERLELFVPVCNAIQHAHQKGVIHRDTKPSNILVSLYDGKAVPKVIDFGVAKAIQHRLTEKTVFTQFGQVIGTLEYMSPEQAEMNQLDIDTRADIYSLGAVLYELLSGNTPFDRERLRSAAFDEMLRIIREEEPVRPSLRLSSSADLPTISAQRQLEPIKLSRTVHGELDWIVMKALEKQRVRRYETASGLGLDIQRFLDDETVEAIPPSTTYRLGKFVRRYRKTLLATACCLLLLSVATIVSTVQSIRATESARLANDASLAKDVALREKDQALQERQTALQRALDAENIAKQNEALAESNALVAELNLYNAHMQQIQTEWERNNLARIRHLLSLYETSDDQRDLRDWEWQYWSRMCQQELRTLRKHELAANAVAFSSDGRHLATAGSDGKVMIWNVADGALLTEIDAHDGIATCVAFSGTVLASGGLDKKLKLWDSHGGDNLATFEYHSGGVGCLAFSHDGSKLAVATTRQVGIPTRGRSPIRRVIDVATRKELLKMDSQRDVRAVAFTQDDSQIIFVASPNLEFWDATSGQLVRKLEVDAFRDNNIQYVETIAIRVCKHTDQIVTAGADQIVRVRSVVDGETLREFRGHADAVVTVALSPDESVIASAGADNSIIFWDRETGDEIRRFQGHEKQVMSVAFSPDGLRLASASNDKTVKIWDVAARTDFRPLLASTRGHYGASRSSDDGHFFAAANFRGPSSTNKRGEHNTHGQQVDLRHSLTGERLGLFRGHRGWIHAIAFSHDGKKLATGAADKTIRIYDRSSQELLQELKLSWAAYWLDFSPDDRWLRISSPEIDPSSQKRVQMQQIWDVVTGQRLALLPATSMAFHPIDNLVAVAAASDDVYSIDLYRYEQLANGEPPFHSWKLETAAQALQFRPGTQELAANLGDDVVLWHVDGSVAKRVISAGRLHGFSPSGQRFFTRDSQSRRKLIVWDTRSTDSLCEIPLPQGTASVMITPHRHRVATRGLVRLHTLELGELDEKENAQLEARNLVAKLLKFPLMRPPYVTKRRSELLQEIAQLSTISPVVRAAATRLLADFYSTAEEAAQFGLAADELLQPGLSKEEHDKGFQLARVASEIDPASWSGMYGYSLFRVGRYEEGLQLMEANVASDIKKEARSAAGMYASIAMAHHQTGDKHEALRFLDKAKTEDFAGAPFNARLIQEAESLIQPDPEGESLLNEGSNQARQQNWPEAAELFEQAATKLVGNMRATCLYYLALTKAALGETDSQQTICRTMRELDLGENHKATDRFGHACVLLPDTLEDWSELTTLCERHAVDFGLQGAVQYRAGNPLEGLKLMPKERKGLPAWNLAFIAMAEYAVGNHDVARSTLGECEQRVEDEAAGKAYSHDWHGKLAGRLLFQEAKQQLSQ